MKEIKFVDAEQVQTIEEYASSLVLGLGQLNTMMLFHIQVAGLGLLSPVEQEMTETCMWEIKRLMKLYHKLTEKVLEKTDLTIDRLHECLQKMSQPPIKGEKPKNPRMKVKLDKPPD